MLLSKLIGLRRAATAWCNCRKLSLVTSPAGLGYFERFRMEAEQRLQERHGAGSLFKPRSAA